MLKQIVQSAIGRTGYRIQKIRDHTPQGHHIDVFGLCMKDLFATTAKPYILQIGANDGIGADPVYNYIRTLQLPALLVEPHPEMFKRLQRNYAGSDLVEFSNAAISSGGSKSIILYAPDDNLVRSNVELAGLCSLSKSQILRELVQAGVSNPMERVVEVNVPSLTASELIQTHGIKTVDVLQIDTEGHDWKILSQFDLEALGVKLINMEFFHLTEDERTACLVHLERQGFEIAFALGDLVARRRVLAT